ncbi:neurogenic locus notch homolog 2-like [Octopus vulgaris]|uniref:Neurogenic locus notch homolog 2-like n=1 Tax=Octopus vulgaris TaxID=6645 RepID=A0AA36AMX8_OCTVU|nr:neurogenic locus notch homolog 2-like [Octopus vulgaris]
MVAYVLEEDGASAVNVDLDIADETVMHLIHAIADLARTVAYVLEEDGASAVNADLDIADETVMHLIHAIADLARTVAYVLEEDGASAVNADLDIADDTVMHLIHATGDLVRTVVHVSGKELASTVNADLVIQDNTVLHLTHATGTRVKTVAYASGRDRPSSVNADLVTLEETVIHSIHAIADLVRTVAYVSRTDINSPVNADLVILDYIVIHSIHAIGDLVRTAAHVSGKDIVSPVNADLVTLEDTVVHRPCKNGGVCIRKGQSFTCKCRPGYVGQYCRTPCQTAVADIVFVLDESGSITRPNFKTIKTFVKNLVSVFPISRKQVRIGVITFSTRLKNEFNLNRYFTHRQLYHAIDRIQYNRGRTNTHLALDYLKKHAFQSEAGGRRHIPQIAIVITDGKSSRPEQTQHTARILKDSGIHIYAIGIGKQVPRSELVTIASHPSKEYIYGINTFRDLSKIQAGLASKTCIASEPCKKNPCQNGGKCVNLWKDFKCICDSGFRGKRCEIVDPCSSSPCKNNGTCINEGYEFRCQCRSGFRGDLCSIVDPCSSSPCKNNGTCKNNGYEFSCQCRDGFRGDVCNIEPPCSSSPCQNGGTCTNENDDFNCQCLPVYRGKDCSIVDPCHIRPCKNNGSCINNGTSYTCECTPYFIGKSCDKAKPDCSCMTFGKMFYRTFDDQMLKFNGSCSETLVKSLPGTNYTDFIVKVIKTKEYSTSEPTVTRIVETKLENTTIRLLPFNTILINSEERSLPLITKDFTVRLSVGWISLTTDWGLTVMYDGVHQAYIKLPISFAEKVEGNCGNCNGKKDDLPSTPNGIIKVYRKGLQVQPRTPCKSEALTVECSQPLQCDTIFKKPEFQKCVQTLGDENVAKLQKSCRASLCSAKNKEDEADKLCEILEAFSSVCGKASIVVKWRSATFCPKFCPNNQEYKSKVLRCQPSCINKTPNCTRYTEGCVCKPGFFLSGEECVSESECGCFKNGIYMKLHEEIYSVDCLTKSICRKGGKVEIIKTGPCQANSECRIIHRKRSCVCNEGYSLYKGNCDNLGFGKFIRVQQALLQISPFYIYLAAHPNNCAKKCQQIKECLAFNYDNKNDICSLLSEDASTNNTLKSEDCEHTDYYQLKKGARNVIKGAALSTCDEKKLVNDINSKPECEKKCLAVKCSALDYSGTRKQCHIFEHAIKHHGLYGDEDTVYVGFSE